MRQFLKKLLGWEFPAKHIIPPVHNCGHRDFSYATYHDGTRDCTFCYHSNLVKKESRH